MVGNDAADDPPDRVPARAQEARDRRLGHLLGEEGADVLEVARVAGSRPGEGHGLDPHPAVAAAHPAQALLDKAALRAAVEVAPASQTAVVDRLDELAAARADDAPSAQRDFDDHPSAPKATSVTLAPGRRSRRLHAVVTRTLSFLGSR